jgi:hypothetical protein
MGAGSCSSVAVPLAVCSRRVGGVSDRSGICVLNEAVCPYKSVAWSRESSSASKLSKCSLELDRADEPVAWLRFGTGAGCPGAIAGRRTCISLARPFLFPNGVESAPDML